MKELKGKMKGALPRKPVAKKAKKAKALKGYIMASPTGVYMAQVQLKKNFMLSLTKTYKTEKGACKAMEKATLEWVPDSVIDWGES